MKAVFGTCVFGARKILKNGFVLVSGGGKDGKKLLVAKVMLWFLV